MTHQVLQSSKYLATQYFEKISIALEAKPSEACTLDFFPSMVMWSFARKTGGDEIFHAPRLDPSSKETSKFQSRKHFRGYVDNL
ncbi:hypothetical protein SNOG_09230 [Parastagonospora nodorum SN15]|uniref:Uncharacterized protein n=1 Tax=Phaeosphaeria nodorum (strain SN15 / ATCC MYA-4574 / FGSC 10173) TaxID=321614 RepID=Q0UG84_PHANO|nr:hypothetical protein SNOG_09230 [Parastagonospora nodorum SN15]EAT83422.1 hypothetical protein SNOG_09230 [Parastagonospora nodorum SN15]